MAIILASQSPRRRELLERLGIRDFIVRPAVAEEIAPDGLSPQDLVLYLSRQKAQEVALSAQADDLIIGADTIVVVDGQVLGKPGDRQQAETMLRQLSGAQHTVLTGVTLIRGPQIRSEVEQTQVRFRKLTDREIRAYIQTGEPMDKAGAYGIQGLGALLVEGIVGDYFNVVGLPLARFGQMIRDFGINLYGETGACPGK